jgi:hypothetical protein
MVKKLFELINKNPDQELSRGDFADIEKGLNDVIQKLEDILLDNRKY